MLSHRREAAFSLIHTQQDAVFQAPSGSKLSEMRCSERAEKAA